MITLFTILVPENIINFLFLFIPCFLKGAAGTPGMDVSCRS